MSYYPGCSEQSMIYGRPVLDGASHDTFATSFCSDMTFVTRGRASKRPAGLPWNCHNLSVNAGAVKSCLRRPSPTIRPEKATMTNDTHLVDQLAGVRSYVASEMKRIKGLLPQDLHLISFSFDFAKGNFLDRDDVTHGRFYVAIGVSQSYCGRHETAFNASAETALNEAVAKLRTKSFQAVARRKLPKSVRCNADDVLKFLSWQQQRTTAKAVANV